MISPRIQPLLPLLLTLAATTSAQNVGQVTGLNAGDIALPIRESWCTSQKKTCSQLCTSSGQTAGSNTCDDNQLSWLCVCEPDGVSPDISSFSDSLASLACNWQLNQCLTEGSTSSATCAYEYVCGGRNASEPLSSPSSPSSGSSSASPPSNTVTTSNPSISQPTTTEQSQSSPAKPTFHNSFAWIAGAVIGLFFILALVFFTLWWRKRKQRPSSALVSSKKHKAATSSVEHLWDKAELDSKPSFKSELHGTSRVYQLDGHPNDSASELEGSAVSPAELDGSSPLSVELSPVSPGLVRGGAYTFNRAVPVSPLSRSSTFGREGEGDETRWGNRS